MKAVSRKKKSLETRAQGKDPGYVARETAVNGIVNGVGQTGAIDTSSKPRLYRHGSSTRQFIDPRQTTRTHSSSTSTEVQRLAASLTNDQSQGIGMAQSDHSPINTRHTLNTGTNNTADKDKNPRRSTRRPLVNHLTEQKGTVLQLTLSSIRKKLNFRSNRLDTSKTEVYDEDDVRPRKRQRRDIPIECRCDVTIWDNRTDTKNFQPLVIASEKCFITVHKVINGVISHFVDIDMPTPISINSEDLQVNVITPGKPDTMVIADNYFLEIKLVPLMSDADLVSGGMWPPIPILSKSEGELFTTAHKGRTAHEALFGSLLARYTHLPIAPDQDVPLSIFYLSDGRCYKSKFGLEVCGMWIKQPEAHKVARIKQEEGEASLLKRLFPALVDHRGRPLGRDLEKTNTIKSSTESNLRRSSRSSVRNGIKPVQSLFEVTYVFDPKSKDSSKERRTATLKGLRCPACRIGIFETLTELRFHLSNFHHKYSFALVEENSRQATSTERPLTRVTIEVLPSQAAPGRPKEIRNPLSEWEWNWESPREAFDIDTHLTDESKWFGDHHHLHQHNNLTDRVKKSSNNKSHATVPKIISTDPITALRQRNNGFLPAELVPEALPDYDEQRSRHKVVHTRTVDNNPVYSSVGHYRLHPGRNPSNNNATATATDANANFNSDAFSSEPGSDYLSESDDEYQLLPGAWEREKHLANLRDQAYSDDEDGRPEGLPQSKIDFMVKWDSHRMEEGLGSTKFIGDCIVRFTRKERRWLRGEVDVDGKRGKREDGEGGWLEFVEFLAKVKERREIDDRLVVGIWGIVWGKGEETTEVEEEQVVEAEGSNSPLNGGTRKELTGKGKARAEPRKLAGGVQNALDQDQARNPIAHGHPINIIDGTPVSTYRQKQAALKRHADIQSTVQVSLCPGP